MYTFKQCQQMIGLLNDYVSEDYCICNEAELEPNSCRHCIATSLLESVFSKDGFLSSCRRTLVIRSTIETDEETGDPLYWSNEMGWVDLTHATYFTQEEADTFDLPANSYWV